MFQSKTGKISVLLIEIFDVEWQSQEIHFWARGRDKKPASSNRIEKSTSRKPLSMIFYSNVYENREKIIFRPFEVDPEETHKSTQGNPWSN